MIGLIWMNTLPHGAQLHGPLHECNEEASKGLTLDITLPFLDGNP